MSLSSRRFQFGCKATSFSGPFPWLGKDPGNEVGGKGERSFVVRISLHNGGWG